MGSLRVLHSLPAVRISGIKTFHMRYTHDSITPLRTQNILLWPSHPEFPLRVRMNAERRAESDFNYDLVITNGTATKSVVRNACRRRFKKAFLQALDQRWLDPLGRLIPLEVDTNKSVGENGKGKEGVVRGGRPFRALKGFAFFTLKTHMITARFPQIKREAELAVERLIELNSR
ncbi:MAG: hypothetical protein M4579_006911 [Chaenotheca gracillima]|nr:MAG: hypothetical protein M4579_006911 [Chaenotheca gracillima]